MELLKTYLPWYLNGFKLTLLLGICAILFGLVLGLALAIMRTSRMRVLRWISGAYISIFQGTPLLLQIIFIYYTLPAFHITLSATASGILGLSLNVGANFGETIRGGILGIPKGQFEAARVLGYSQAQTMFRIILPQTFKVILPSLSSFAIIIMKDTSLVSCIALEELMRVSQLVRAATFKPAESFLIAAAFYYILVLAMKKVFSVLEKRVGKR